MKDGLSPETLDKSELNQGLVIRKAVLLLTGTQRFRSALASLSSSVGGFVIPDALDEQYLMAVRNDLLKDPSWGEEHWILNDRDEVIAVEKGTFDKTNPRLRFSKSDCLRHPLKSSWALRGFLSAVMSSTIEDSLSRHMGFPVKSTPAEIARYRYGHYIRRHADTFEDRCIALVWFFGEPWQAGFGGELIVEAASGEALCIPPISGAVAGIAIRPENYHQVLSVRDQHWARYSAATHYRRIYS